MKHKKVFIYFLFIAGIIGCTSNPTQKQEFQPTFESLEKVNPVPEWFKDAKFGIYFHWGVYSVPAFANEWYPRNIYINKSPENMHHIDIYGDLSEWPYNNFITGAKDKQGNYVQFAPKLKSEGGQFDPEEWAQLFADAGAKFAGPVAEHHDGFSMWASRVNPWNAKDMGPKLDLVGLLTSAIRKKDMKVILSMHHAFNITGFFEAVPKTNYTILQKLYGQQGKQKNEAFWLAKHKEIIDNYQPDIIWQDFNLPIISQPVLLEFLAYYYNKAAGWNKEVVATYKDGLNEKCAVLDFERGGALDVTPNYWLTDDAISSSSWCYTDGLQYYSAKQVFHGFIDRISKNGNLLLNISPKADGSIPQEQKDILLAMGAWLKKYGEAVYATRAWEIYGEGPTKMGADHGVFTAPAEGSYKDIRFTRSKDKTTLYAILLGWNKGQKETVINSLSSKRINLEKLKSVSLINGEAGKYLSLDYKQTTDGLIVNLPSEHQEELAYALKLSFDGEIPSPDKYADIDCKPNYYIVSGHKMSSLVLGSDFTLTDKRKDQSNQWKLETVGKGFYKILNRQNIKTAMTYNVKSIPELAVTDFIGKDNQLWKIENTCNGFKVSNKQFPEFTLSMNADLKEGTRAEMKNPGTDAPFGWRFKEVCDLKQEAFKLNYVPGTIEAEDFDSGCPGDAYFEKDETNSGGQYRPNMPVDIDKCVTGGYLVGWTDAGEWLAYTVTIKKTAKYRVTFYISAPSDKTKIHLEFNGIDKTGTIPLPNTGGYQNWKTVEKTVQLETGNHILKLAIDVGGLNIDKIVFKEVIN